MPLTLNSNSLAIGGAGSGVTTAQVSNLITGNTPWNYIETLTANNSTELDFTNSNITNYDSFYIHFDNISLENQTNTRLRIFVDGVKRTDGYYSEARHEMTGASQVGSGGAGASYWTYGGNNYTWQYGLTGAMYISGKAQERKAAKWNISGGVGSSATIKTEGGGFYNNTSEQASPITGFNFFCNSGGYASGKLHLYGLNKHD